MGEQLKKDRRFRLEIKVSATTLAAIDDYRFATRAPNRAEGVRRLLKIDQAADPPGATILVR
jgi:hypothetical protein